MKSQQFFALAALFLFSSLGFAQSNARELNEIIGMKGSSSENFLEDEGYHFEKVDKSSAAIYQYWWNSRKGKCVTVRLEDGRVKSVVNTSEFDCGKSGSSNSNHSNDSSRDNDDLNLYSFSGMYENRASTELQDKGYRVTKQSGSSVISMYWFKERTNQCLLMTVQNDKVKSVTKTSTSLCDGSSNGASYNNYDDDRNHGSSHGVTLYSDCRFKGHTRTLSTGRYDHDELGVGNDKVSSIRVPRGYKVTVYKDGGWSGSHKTIYEDNGCLESSWNDRISSVKVERD